MSKFLRNVLGPLWLLIVVSYYFKYHGYYYESLKELKGTLIITIVWLLLLGTIIGIIFLQKKRSLNLTPINLIIGVFVFTLVTGSALYTHINPAILKEPYQIIMDGDQIMVAEEGAELNQDFGAVIGRGDPVWYWDYAQEIFPEELRSLFETKSVAAFTGNLAVNLLKMFGWWLFLVFIFYNLGATMLRQKKLEVISFFEAIGVGMAVITGGLFLLGAFGFLSRPFVWGLVIFAGLIGVKKTSLFWEFMKSKKQIFFEKKNWWIPLLILTVGAPLVMNFIEILIPYPSGFDSIARYQNTSNLLTQYGALIPNSPPHNMELLFSLGRFLFGSSMLGASFSVFGALLAFGLLFALLNKKFKWEESLLLTALFISLPMNQFMLHIDLKTDLPLLFFSLLAIYSVIKSRYVLTGIWLGLCLGIKATSTLLILTVFSYFSFVFWGVWAAIGAAFFSLSMLGFQGIIFFLKNFSHGIETLIYSVFLILGIAGFGLAFKKKFPTKNQLKSLILTGLFLVLTFSPWLVKNGLESGSLSISFLLNGPTPVITETVKSIEPLNECVFAEFGNEINQYSGFFKGNPLFTPLVLLWESSINSGLPNNSITDIGFLFLGLLILAIFAFKEAQKKDHDLKKITLFTLFYILLWAISSQGIIWYGMTLFVGLLFIYGQVFRVEKWSYVILAVWFLITFSLHCFEIQMNSRYLLSAGGLLSEVNYTEALNPGANEMMSILNSQNNLSKNVYLVGGFVNYFIEQNDQRIYRDYLLDDFMCRFYDENPQIVLDRLREANFGFIIFSDKGINFDLDSENILKDRFFKFENFIDNNLIREVYRSEISLYSIPD